MKSSEHWKRLAPYLLRPHFTTEEAREAGVLPRMLPHFMQHGKLERISRGIYRSSGFLPSDEEQWADLATMAETVPDGVICLISALCIYEMTDQLMREYWIAVPHSKRAPQRPEARVIRMRNVELGSVDAMIAGRRVKIFDRERTIVDTFRFLDMETAMTALRYYLEGQKPDVDRLLDYARQLRVNLLPYIQALTA